MKNLKSVEIGDYVKKIGAGAFYGAKKLKSVYLGKRVKTFGKKAFLGIAKKAVIYIKTEKNIFAKVRKIEKSGISKGVSVVLFRHK